MTFCAFITFSTQAEVNSNYNGLAPTNLGNFFTSVTPSTNLLLPIFVHADFRYINAKISITTRKPGTPHHRLIPDEQPYKLKQQLINMKTSSKTESDAKKSNRLPLVDSPTKFEFELPDGTKVEEESIFIPAKGDGDGEVIKRGSNEYRSVDGVPIQVEC